LQNRGLDYGGEEFAQSLLSLTLVRRNAAAIRYRMRNISSVAEAMGLPTLAAFSPAPRVGSGVRNRIEAFLKSDAFITDIASTAIPSAKDAKSTAVSALQELQIELDDVEQQFGRMGHNGPPEPMSEPMPSEIFSEARENIKAIEQEIASQTPAAEAVSQSSERLIVLTGRLAAWAGERFTRFADASLKIAAPLIVAKIFGLMPTLVSALEAVAKAMVG
jgi:hypothetical protein